MSPRARAALPLPPATTREDRKHSSSSQTDPGEPLGVRFGPRSFLVAKRESCDEVFFAGPLFWPCPPKQGERTQNENKNTHDEDLGAAPHTPSPPLETHRER
ncbi:unnamed protein product, partial [Ectocarpus sp. 4 AP-2014]